MNSSAVTPPCFAARTACARCASTARSCSSRSRAPLTCATKLPRPVCVTISPSRSSSSYARFVVMTLMRRLPCEQPHGRQRLPCRKLARDDLRPELPRDLLVDRSAVRVGKNDVHALPPPFIVYTHYIQYPRFVKSPAVDYSTFTNSVLYEPFSLFCCICSFSAVK